MLKEKLLAISLLLIFTFSSCELFEKDIPYFTKGPGMPDTLMQIIGPIDSLSREWFRNGDMLGAECLIIHDKTILFHKTYGICDLPDSLPLEKNMLFRIRSMTKPVVGTAVQLLAAEGKLSLDDSVSQYIKTFQNERSRTITIRQLLTHTGGFTQPGFPRGSIYQYTSLSDAVAHLGEIGPDVPPGSEFIYSDAGTSTLTEIVSRVSGMSADQYIHSRIFNPLGMHNSFCFVPDQRRVRKHTNSTFEWKDSCFVEYWDRFDEPEIPFFRGSGGIYCTAKDYARFLHEWARPGNSFLSAEVKEVALKPGELSQSYGMQWEIIHSENGKMEVFGHGGSDGTLGMAIPGKKLLICYFTQSRSSLTVGRFKRYILDALNIRKIDPVKAIKIPEEKLEIFCGRFENEHYFIRTEFMVKNHKFYYTVNGSPRIHLIPVSKNSFEMEDMDYKIDFIQKNGRCNALKIYNNEKSYDLQRID